MTGSKGPQDRSFYPGVAYPLSQVANNLEVSEKWVKENMIYPKKNDPDKRKCDHKKAGNVYIFMGEWIIKWMRGDYDFDSDDGES